MKDKIKEIKELVEKLNRYCYEYYTLGKSTITDETYDKLYDDLLKLEKESGIVLSNSPTQKVGNVVLNKLQKSTHEQPLLSLDKTKDINVLSNFTKGRDGILMLKLDGITVDLTYDNGILQKAESRGDGSIGEDITNNVKQFTNVPLTIPHKGKIHVVGEAIITYDVFNEINSKLLKDEQYKNPRNLVSGSVRQLDSNICKQRQVKFVAYNLFGTDIKYKYEQLQWMLEQGFQVVGGCHVSKESMKVRLNFFVNSLKESAEAQQIPIDGLVMAYNDIEYGDSLGKTSHHFNHSLAFKFNEDVEITTLRNIEWQVGRTGVITPVAVFDEAELAGTTVSKASVHNISILQELQLGIGDEISVYKANEIIPQIKDNLTKSNNLEIPEVCPSCNHPTEIEDSGTAKFLMCNNPNCKAQLVQTLSHFVSRQGMNIVGLSEKTIEAMVEKEVITNIVDIYKLQNHKQIILSIDKMGTTKYNNLIRSIESSRSVKLSSLIYALGIKGVGISTARDVSEHFNNSIESIINASYNDFLKVKDVGDITARNLVDYFNDGGSKDILYELLQYLEIETEQPKSAIEAEDNPLKGKHVYPTGKFNLKKSDLKAELEKLGAIVETSYKRSLDLLICGNDMSKSGKADKAITDGVNIMTEEEMMGIFREF